MSEALMLFQADGESFEDAGKSNGGRYWYALEFMRMLGYESFQSFKQAINRAIATCSTLNIPVIDNFQQIDREVNGSVVDDYKLSRFACYLVAMNGDVRKAPVAAAQAYFATLAEAARLYMQASHDMERVQIRDDVAGAERGLSSAAKKAGVTEYQLFQNAGYRGMYNMNLSDLKVRKGLKDRKRSLLDFMDKRELAGNQFRIAETEARLRATGVVGQRPAESVATDVGRKVRKMMIENDGTRPEEIPLVGDIDDVRKTLKKTAREFVKIDKPKASSRAPKRSD